MRKHVRRYVDSEGKKGHCWNGVATLLLTTRGRRTGKLRRTALIYGRDHDYLVVASNGGSKPHPNWYQNLVADPHVSVRVGEETFEAIARTATGPQKPKLWEEMVAIWPDYAKYQKKYQKKTEREIPVVILERRPPEG